MSFELWAAERMWLSLPETSFEITSRTLPCGRVSACLITSHFVEKTEVDELTDRDTSVGLFLIPTSS